MRETEYREGRITKFHAGENISHSRNASVRRLRLVKTQVCMVICARLKRELQRDEKILSFVHETNDSSSCTDWTYTRHTGTWRICIGPNSTTFERSFRESATSVTPNPSYHSKEDTSLGRSETIALDFWRPCTDKCCSSSNRHTCIFGEPDLLWATVHWRNGWYSTVHDRNVWGLYRCSNRHCASSTSPFARAKDPEAPKNQNGGKRHRFPLLNHIL